MHWGLSESLDLYEEYVRALKGLPPVDYSAWKEHEKREKAANAALHRQGSTDPDGACGDNTPSGSGSGSAAATDQGDVPETSNAGNQNDSTIPTQKTQKAIENGGKGDGFLDEPCCSRFCGGEELLPRNESSETSIPENQKKPTFTRVFEENNENSATKMSPPSIVNTEDLNNFKTNGIPTADISSVEPIDKSSCPKKSDGEHKDSNINPQTDSKTDSTDLEIPTADPHPFQDSNFDSNNLESTKNETVANIPPDSGDAIECNEKDSNEETVFEEEKESVEILSKNLETTQLKPSNETHNLSEKNLETNKMSETNLHSGKLSETNLHADKVSETNLHADKLSEINLLADKVHTDKLSETNSGKLSETNLHADKVSETNLHSGKLSETNLHAGKLSETNLHANKLGETNLQPHKLSETNLQPHKLGETNLHADTMSETNLHADKLSETNLHSGKLSETNLHANKVSETNLHADKMSETNLHADKLSETNLHANKLSETNLHSGKLSETNLDANKLSETNLDANKLSETNLDANKLSETNLDANKLSETNLHSGKLSETNLHSGKLSETNLHSGKLSETNLHTDKLSETNLHADKLSEANLLADKLSETNLHANKLSETNLHANKLSETNLQSGKLSETNLQSGKLSETNLQSGKLSETNLQSGKLSETNLQSGKLSETALHADKLSETNLHADKLSETNLHSGKLSETNLHSGKLSETTLQSGKLSETNLHADKLSETNLHADKVSETNLHADKLSETNLHADKLSETNLHADKLSETNLHADKLSETNLHADKLSETNLHADKLSETNLHGDKLSETNLSAKKLSETNLLADKLSETNLHSGKLSETNLHANKLSETNLHANKLSETNLHANKLSETNLHSANLNEENLHSANLSETIKEADKLSETNLDADKLSETNIQADKLSDTILETTDSEEKESISCQGKGDGDVLQTSDDPGESDIASESKDCKSKNCQSDKTTESEPDLFYGEQSKADLPLPRTVNILLFGAGDPRHIIHTAAKLYKHNQDLASSGDSSNIELNFYVLDGCIEIVARNMALLAVALEQSDILPLRTKTHFFMDIFGNSLLRPSSHQYLAGKAKTLRSLITDVKIREKLTPFLDIESLKYSERDSLENAFNFWLPKEGHYYNIQQYWSSRNRILLSSRYDYRDGAFDWDLSMTLKDRGAAQICSQEYRYWRESGIAFTYPEYEQCKPNKTFAAALVRNGETYLHRGYVGDLQTGPFCAFGIKCGDKRMTNSQHGDNDYRSTEITERNLLEYFYELENHSPYEHKIENSRRYGSAKLLMGKTLQWNECDLNTMQSYDKPWLPMEGVKIKFLPLCEVFAMQSDPLKHWKDFFDIVFVGHNYFSFLRPPFVNVMKDNSLLILETKLWTIGRKDTVKQFEKELKEFAKTANLKPALNYNAINAHYSSMKFKKVPGQKVKT